MTPDLSPYGQPPYQVTFWYHMYGEHTGTLEVYEWTGLEKSGPVWTAPAEAKTTSEYLK